MKTNDDGTVEFNKNSGPRIQVVLIGVYYEALCPDSKGFVIRQLEPMYKKLQNNVMVQMIPYGKATVSNFAYFI